MNRKRLIDLLAMSRFANLPTVWSNVLLGAILGWGTFGTVGHVCPTCLALIGLGISFLYLGGCFFNDWFDTEFDRKSRPDRAIPSGRWKRSQILTMSISLMGAGVILTSFVSLASGFFAMGIVACIVAYTKWHKTHPVSFFFMGAARAMIYPTAAFSFLSLDQFWELGSKAAPLLSICGLGLGLYILGISLSARAEASSIPVSDAAKAGPVALLCAPLLFFSGPLLASGVIAAVIPAVVFIAVLAIIVRRQRAAPNVGRFVSRTLAVIPLVDFLLVFPLAPHPAFLLLCPLFVLMSFGLQKIAPAT